MPDDITWYMDPQAVQRLREAALAAVTAAALVVEGQVKQLTPVDTGGLRDSITHETHQAGQVAEAAIGSALDYSVYQEFGTGDFATNGAGRKGGWSYQAPDGNWHFTHGNKPQRMFRNGIKRSEKNAINAMNVVLARLGQ